MEVYCVDCGIEMAKRTIDGVKEEICINPECPTPCFTCGNQMELMEEHWFCRTEGCSDYQYTLKEIMGD